MKKTNTFKKNISEIKKMSAKYPKTIKEALDFNALEDDDMDMEMEDEPMDEPAENKAGINIENFITTMRKQSLDIMSELADNPDDPVYDFAKKIWQLAEKAYNDKKGGVILKDKLVIKKKPLKGDDGYKTFSIRIKDETSNALDKLAQDTNRSRNELINILLDYAIQNCEIHE